MEYAIKNVVHPFHQPNLFFLFFFFSRNKKKFPRIPRISRSCNYAEQHRAKKSEKHITSLVCMCVCVCICVSVCIFLSTGGSIFLHTIRETFCYLPLPHPTHTRLGRVVYRHKYTYITSVFPGFLQLCGCIHIHT